MYLPSIDNAHIYTHVGDSHLTQMGHCGADLTEVADEDCLLIVFLRPAPHGVIQSRQGSR